MNRSQRLRSTTLGLVALAIGFATLVSTAVAVPVEFVPLNSLVNGPPYPTPPLQMDIVASPAGTPLGIDQVSTVVDTLNPIGATDWYVSDVLTFGIEREMKESGEKGGTADINIGVGELQECTITKSMDTASMQLAQFAINGNSLGTAEIHFVEVAGSGSPGETMMLTLFSEYTTPQPAMFTDVSIVLGSDGRSYDLNFSLLYSAPYDPALPILHEVVTGELVPIPEPSTAVALVGLCGWVWLLRSRSRRR